MINILIWKWKPHYDTTPKPVQGRNPIKSVETYTAAHVNTMAAMLRKNMHGDPMRIICITDDPTGIDKCETFPLWNDYNTLFNVSGKHLPSCYRRLKMFDLPTLNEMGIAKGQRVASIDIDSVIVGDMRPIFDKQGPFVGWGVRGTFHPRVFNGSFSMWDAGAWQDLWSTFNPIESPKQANAKGYFGSDQGWISMNLAKRVDVQSHGYPMMVSWPNEARRLGKIDIRNRVVFFHGRQKPWHPDTIRISPWITKYWRLEQ